MDNWAEEYAKCTSFGIDKVTCMARSVIRLEKEECEIFHANYCYMWKKLNTAPYYVCGYGETPEWINSPWLLPSYVNLSKCLNPAFVPSMNIVNKIVQFYNANITPTVDVYVFLHERLEKSDGKRSVGDNSILDELKGLYYGYYYAGIEDEAHIYGALIRIYSDGSNVSAMMIAGLTDNDMLTDENVRNLISNKEVELAAYKEFKKKLPLAKRRTTIYKGPVAYVPGMMTLALKDADRDNNYLHIRVPINQGIDDRYIGSLGIITMVSENFNIQFLKVGIERADETELAALELEDEKLFELLRIKKAVNEHVYLSTSENVRWTDYLINNAT